MTFDSVVSHFEQRLFPSLREMEALARESGHFKHVEIVSVRHVDCIHAMGINCSPKWALEQSESLTFKVLLSRLNRPHAIASASIGWSQTFDTRTGKGYDKSEGRGFSVSVVGEEDIQQFVEGWERMTRHFRRIIRNGRPSSRFVRWLRGAPRDRFGCKR